jgi:hypothetical protein
MANFSCPNVPEIVLISFLQEAALRYFIDWHRHKAKEARELLELIEKDPQYQ